MVAGAGVAPAKKGLSDPSGSCPSLLFGASVRLRSGLCDLQDRTSTLRALAKMVRVEGVAPSRLSALVPKTSVSAYFTTRGWHVGPGAAPGPVGFGVRPAQAGARHVKKEMRSPGVAPGSSRWQRNSLLFNLRPQKPKRTNTYRV
jgi:hypothetical protein